tara:strand:- start:899 stop:1771 length:873 start_codon:yes stop_codon:yes gene_type:complete
MNYINDADISYNTINILSNKYETLNFENNIDILNNLKKLYESNNIPNLIFHGPNMSGKKTLMENFLKIIYKTYCNIKKFTLIINCSHGKGNIKFIRDNLKYFANSIINNNKNNLFKSIILLNADNLTIDAQSALRRLIELYNHSTRFFIIVKDKHKILKPILSRFSEIYCNKTRILNNTKEYNFTNKKLYNLNKFIKFDENIVENNNSENSLLYLIELSKILYNNGFTCNLLIKYIDNKIQNNDNNSKLRFFITLENYKKEFRDEKLLILFCLNFLYFKNMESFDKFLFL